MRSYRYKKIAATPYAKSLASRYGLDLEAIASSGGVVKGADVERAAASKTGGARITPLARRMAGARGIDRGSIRGSGYGGKIVSADVLNAQSSPSDKSFDARDAVRAVGMTRMRRVIAARMQRSSQEIPAVTQNVEVDATELLELHKSINEGRARENRVSVNDLLIRATALVTREHERFRMQLGEDDSFILHSAVNVGFAVGMDDGLLVPVIKRADEMSVFQISDAAKALIKNARANSLKPSDYGCGVITISNMGMYKVHSFTPIINQPEASILGVGAPTERLVLNERGIEVRKFIMLSLTFDHRIINGAEAAEFELDMKRVLEQPGIILQD
jgi:pyruvate dehydrogenase E2 component (dihydrolipoamide acetyltransferase)